MAITINGGSTTYSTIQDAINAASAGDTIEIAAGTYNEDLTIDKGLAFVGDGDVTIAPGSGAAVSFVAAGVGGDVSFDNIDLDGTSTAARGILIDAGSDVGELSFSNGTISGFSTQGIFSTDDGDPVANPTLGNLVLDNASFADNGSGGGNTAHVKLFGFDGDATISNVTFDGASPGTAVVDRPDNAIEITGGLNAPDSANPAPASSPNIGDVTIDNVTVSGEYEKNTVGIFNFGELDGLSITDLDLAGAESTWDLFNIDGTSDSTIDATAYGIAYPSGGGVVGDLQGEKPDQPDVDTEIIGTAANEFLNGKRGNDDLDGAGGDDILVGGPGDDEVDGGDGTDVAVIVADAGGVAIGDLSPPLSFTGVSVTDGSASFTLVGPDGDDDYTDVEVLRLNDTGSDTYLVLPGMSVAAAALAAEEAGLEDGDTIVVENVDDEVTTFVYDDTSGEFEYDEAASDVPPSEGTPLDDLIDLRGETEDQTVSSGAGDDFVWGGDGDDSIDGEAGNDDIRGQGGDDIVLGGDGNDVLRGNPGDDLVEGGPGSDELKGGPGIDHGVVANATEDYADVADYDFNDYSFSRDSGDTDADFDGTLTHPDGEGGTETETLTGLEVMEIAETGSSTLVVSPGMDIQAAIDAASDGDTIQLLSGSHNASASGTGGIVTVDKEVTILGPNAGISPLGPFAVRAPEASLGVRFDVIADDVTIDGVRFSGAGADPEPVANFQGANGALLNTIAVPGQTPDFPIVRVTGDDATVRDNLLDRGSLATATAPAIDASGVDAVTIDGNTIDNGWIAVNGASGAVEVTNNIVDNPNVGGLEDYEIIVTGASTGSSGGPVDSLEASGNMIVSTVGGSGVYLYGTPDDDDFRGYETNLADILLGFAGNDVIEGGFGDDFIRGGAGNDSIDGGAGENELIGGSGNDSLDGGASNDGIFGRSGNDVIDGGAGDDFISGDLGVGVDYSAAGGAGNDVIDGGAGDDFITGDYGTAGGSGNDSIDGGAGNDTIYGDSGNDEIDGGADRDELHGNDGDDTISGGDRRDFIYGDSGNDEIEGGNGWDGLTGGAGDDDINGGNGNDTLDGGDGADILRGQDGSDTLNGGGGDDVLRGGGGGNELFGDGGADHLIGDDVSDTLDGGAGTDVLWGGRGDDILAGGGAADDLVGGGGDDAMDGGGGTDSLVGAAGEDVMDGGTGADILEGGQSDDTLDGNDGFDVLSGGGGDDMLTGGGGDDEIDGGGGLDVATYAYNMYEFAITVDDAGNIIVEDIGTGDEGTDTVARDVELLRFDVDDSGVDVTTAFIAEEGGSPVTVDNILAGLGAGTIVDVAGATPLASGKFELAVEGGGLLVEEEGEVTFTPDGPIDGLSVGESLTVEFDMTLSGGSTTRGAVVIQGVNDAPTADPSVEISTGENETVDGNILDEANAEDPDGDPIVVGAVDGTDLSSGTATVTGDDGGILEIEDDGNYTFDPADYFEGLLDGEELETTFKVVISDGNGGEAEIDLTVTVNGEDDFRSEPGDRDQPVARADRGFTIHGPEKQYLGNVIDNDVFGVGDLTVVDFDKTGGSDNGTFYLEPSGRLFFEGDDGGIPGRTTFNYTIEDQDDQRSSATIEVDFASGPATPFALGLFPTDPGDDVFTA